MEINLSITFSHQSVRLSGPCELLMPHDFPPLGRHVLMSGNDSKERPPTTSNSTIMTTTTNSSKSSKPSQLGLFCTTTTTSEKEKENGRLVGGGGGRGKTTTLPTSIPTSNHSSSSSIPKHIYDSDAKTFYTVGKFLGKVKGRERNSHSLLLECRADLLVVMKFHLMSVENIMQPR